MKKFIYLLILAVAIASAGCSTYEPTYTPTVDAASAVIGHTYKYTSGNNYISMYFASNHVCTYTSRVNGDFISISNLTYRTDGTNVDVYADNSSYWQDSKRNTLLYHMVYQPSSDAITWESLVFKRYD